MQAQLIVPEAGEVTDRLPLLSDAAPRRRVLLVEDDPDLRRLIGAALRRDSYEVIETESGRDLLVHMRNQAQPLDRFDAIISDVKLPHLTALEVLAGTQWQPLETPVILMTAFGSPSTRPEAHALGAVAILDKPVDLNDLRAMLRGVAARNRRWTYRGRWDA